MIYLSTEQLIRLHRDIVRVSGGTEGLRERGLLESAVASALQTFDGDALYPTLRQKAARLGSSLIGNHCFLDGNKRIGIHAMLVLLALNGVQLRYTQQELAALGLAAVAGQCSFEMMEAWLAAHEEL